MGIEDELAFIKELERLNEQVKELQRQIEELGKTKKTQTVFKKEDGNPETVFED
jgi:prefoldin subunit 5